MKQLITFCLMLFSIISSANTVQGNIESAIYLMKGGNYDKAEVLLESITNDDPRCNALKGINYLHLGRVLAAEKYLFKAAKALISEDSVSTELIPTLKALSIIYENKGDEMSNEANILNKLIEKSPFYYDGYLELKSLKDNAISIEEHFDLLNAKLITLYANEYYGPLKYAMAKEIQRIETTHQFQNLYSSLRLFAGIEIGSKGVKLSIIKLKSDLKGEYAYEIVKDSSINTDIISFTDDALSRTIDAVSRFYAFARQMSIDDNRMFFAISNGVKSRAEAEFKLPMLKTIQDRIRLKIGQPSKEIYVLTEEDEPKLTHLGVINKANRDAASIFDLGSGNTKGGYFTYNSSEFNSFSFEWGTKAIALHIDKIHPNTSVNEFANLVQLFVDSIMATKVNYMLDSRGSMYNKDQVVLSGGINWAIASISKPGSLEYAFAPVTIEDVVKFKSNAINNYNEMRKIENYLWQIKPDEEEAVKNEIGRVFDTFTQRELIAGATLLEAMMNKFILSSAVPKKFYLARYGYIGWITGQIIRSLGSEK